jgi:hypothetical protein
MAATFSDLFRKSQFASLRPNQVISKRIGNGSTQESEYGLKHSLPSSGPLSVQLLKVDTPGLKKPKIKSAWQLNSLMKNWKENFAQMTPVLTRDQRSKLLQAFVDQRQNHTKSAKKAALKNETKPDPFYKTHEESLVTMSPESLGELLRDASEKRDEFLSLLSRKYLTPNEWALFLDISSLAKAPEASSLPAKLDPQLFPIPIQSSGFIHPPTYASCHPVNESLSETSSKDKQSSTPNKSLPKNTSTESNLVKVKGRVLNKVAGGYAVGVAGMVAFLPDAYFAFDVLIKQGKGTSTLPLSSSPSNNQQQQQQQVFNKQGPSMSPSGKLSTGRLLQISRDSVYEFYVKSVSIDPHGRPNIILSAKQPDSFSRASNKFNSTAFARTSSPPLSAFSKSSSTLAPRTSSFLAESKKAPLSNGKSTDSRMTVLQMLERAKK